MRSTLHGENVLHRQRDCQLFALLQFHANFDLRCTCVPSEFSASDIDVDSSFPYTAMSLRHSPQQRHIDLTYHAILLSITIRSRQNQMEMVLDLELQRTIDLYQAKSKE